MPEGDTIHRVARRLRPFLLGQTLVQVETRGRQRRPLFEGRTVEAIEARGKHLLVQLSGGSAAHVHLGMKGKWHRYAPGEAWQKKPSQAALVLATSEHVCVCFNPKVAELLEDVERRGHPALTRLGPDLLGPEVDPEEVLARVRRIRPADPLGVVLLDQTIACGIGNVYKSEVPFLLRVSPLRPVNELDDSTLWAIYEQARQLLRQNLAPGPRVTRERGAPRQRGSARYYVYNRSGRPCFRCRTVIRRALLGEQARSTYWCPRCQPDAGAKQGRITAPARPGNC